MYRLILFLGMGALCCSLVGCTTFRQMDAMKDAIDHGAVSGLSASNRWSATVWSNSDAGQPYSTTKGFPVTVQVSPTDFANYAFYLGKSTRSKKWEVFAVFKWRDGHWEQVPVTLPGPESGK